jgi:hypothetical protein
MISVDTFTTSAPARQGMLRIPNIAVNAIADGMAVSSTFY